MLRNKRKMLGLTQDQFIHGIISKSFYSKVERGLNEISAKDLFAILEANNIN
ncbi:MAG: helix-turn-helix domain-containing protein, partial [Lactobacillus paragasseri]